MLLQRRVLPVWALLGLLLASTASAEKIYTSFFGVALGGYDPVTYFAMEGKPAEPKKGKSKYTWKWQGAKWRFVSEKNMALFQANPRQYAPQYGGHCAWAVGAKNALVKGSPKYWRLVDGKLYLNYDASVQKKWEKDIPGFIEKADANWPALSE